MEAELAPDEIRSTNYDPAYRFEESPYKPGYSPYLQVTYGNWKKEDIRLESIPDRPYAEGYCVIDFGKIPAEETWTDINKRRGREAPLIQGKKEAEAQMDELTFQTFKEAARAMVVLGMVHAMAIRITMPKAPIPLGRIRTPKVTNASKRVTTFKDKAFARKALSGNQQAAANRFFKGATSKSTNFKVTDLGGGKQRLEFFTPARNQGYGKVYIQEIDARGAVIREFKQTIGPKGLIETKWLHGGPFE